MIKDDYRIFRQGFFQQQVSENLITVFGHFVLLVPAAVVLEREDERVLGRDERAVADRVDHILQTERPRSGIRTLELYRQGSLEAETFNTKT